MSRESASLRSEGLSRAADGPLGHLSGLCARKGRLRGAQGSGGSVVQTEYRLLFRKPGEEEPCFLATLCTCKRGLCPRGGQGEPDPTDWSWSQRSLGFGGV